MAFQKNTKTANTSGGDPIDISWAVDGSGNPVNLSSIQYVRVYTGAAQMNGIFGEVSTEACGIAACTGSGSGAANKDLEVYIDNAAYDEIQTSYMTTKPVNVSGSGTYDVYSDADYVYINGNAVNCTSSNPYSFTVTLAQGETAYYQIITQNGTESPFVTLLKFTGI